METYSPKFRDMLVEIIRNEEETATIRILAMELYTKNYQKENFLKSVQERSIVLPRNDVQWGA